MEGPWIWGQAQSIDLQSCGILGQAIVFWYSVIIMDRSEECLGRAAGQGCHTTEDQRIGLAPKSEDPPHDEAAHVRLVRVERVAAAREIEFC